MGKLLALVVGLCAIHAGLAQSGGQASTQVAVPPLTDARAVDLQAAWVEWSPAGDCLAYSKEQDSGTVIGLYLVGAPQPSPLFQTKKGDSWKLQWFESQDAALVTVTSVDQHAKRVAVYLLDARLATTTKLFEDVAAPGDYLEIDAELSPLLEHAIFTLHKGDAIYSLILPQGGSSLVRSTDLELAARQGYLGPKWASSGTAFYLDRKSADVLQARGLPGSGSLQDQLMKAILKSLIDTADNATASGDPGSDDAERSLRLSMIQSMKDTLTPAPPAGSQGLELMSDVGALRPVSSPGPWQEPNRVKINATPSRAVADVTSGKLRGTSQSLWLTGPNKSWSVLVAPSVQNAWLSPSGASIAYMVDGALFVRSLKL